MWNNRINLIKESADELGVGIAQNRYCHYTSLPVLFEILENDECWITNVRFSNDSSEELLLGDMRSIRDDYIMCCCDSDDQLSQWRGYCHNGGASIVFYGRIMMIPRILNYMKIARCPLSISQVILRVRT